MGKSKEPGENLQDRVWMHCGFKLGHSAERQLNASTTAPAQFPICNLMTLVDCSALIYIMLYRFKLDLALTHHTFYHVGNNHYRPQRRQDCSHSFLDKPLYTHPNRCGERVFTNYCSTYSTDESKVVSNVSTTIIIEGWNYHTNKSQK